MESKNLSLKKIELKLFENDRQKRLRTRNLSLKKRPHLSPRRLKRSSTKQEIRQIPVTNIAKSICSFKTKPEDTENLAPFKVTKNYYLDKLKQNNSVIRALSRGGGFMASGALNSERYRPKITTLVRPKALNQSKSVPNINKIPIKQLSSKRLMGPIHLKLQRNLNT